MRYLGRVQQYSSKEENIFCNKKNNVKSVPKSFHVLPQRADLLLFDLLI